MAEMVTPAEGKFGDGSACSPRAAPFVLMAYRELNLATNGSKEQHMAVAVSWAHQGWGPGPGQARPQGSRATDR